MYQHPDDSVLAYEEAALAETVPPTPAPERPVYEEPDACDSLWLPPCPVCSWVKIAEPYHQDRLEFPGFYLARHTTQKWGGNFYKIQGCDHASQLGISIGPTRNRLRLAIAWRKRAKALAEHQFNERYPEQLRQRFLIRLSHPSIIKQDERDHPPPDPKREPTHISNQFGALKDLIRKAMNESQEAPAPKDHEPNP